MSANAPGFIFATDIPKWNWMAIWGGAGAKANGSIDPVSFMGNGYFKAAFEQYLMGPYVPMGPGDWPLFLMTDYTWHQVQPPLPKLGESFATYISRVSGTHWGQPSGFYKSVQDLTNDIMGLFPGGNDAVAAINAAQSAGAGQIKVNGDGSDFTITWPKPGTPKPAAPATPNLGVKALPIKLGNLPVASAAKAALSAKASAPSASPSSGAAIAMVAGGGLLLFFLLRR